MVSDIGKADPPLYDGEVLGVMVADGMFNRSGSDDVRAWIEGFA